MILALKSENIQLISKFADADLPAKGFEAITQRKQTQSRGAKRKLLSMGSLRSGLGWCKAGGNTSRTPLQNELQLLQQRFRWRVCPLVVRPYGGVSETGAVGQNVGGLLGLGVFYLSRNS